MFQQMEVPRKWHRPARRRSRFNCASTKRTGSRVRPSRRNNCCRSSASSRRSSTCPSQNAPSFLHNWISQRHKSRSGSKTDAPSRSGFTRRRSRSCACRPDPCSRPCSDSTRSRQAQTPWHCTDRPCSVELGRALLLTVPSLRTLSHSDTDTRTHRPQECTAERDPNVANEFS